MQVQYYKQYSHNLEREMEWKQYGQEGQGVLVFPSQDQRFYEWEDQGMVAVLAPMIESGQLYLICCDSIDRETWSLTEGNQHERIELHERWFNYISSCGDKFPNPCPCQKLCVSLHPIKDITYATQSISPAISR